MITNVTITGTGSGNLAHNASGIDSGTPTASGTFHPTVTVTDAGGAKESVSFYWFGVPVLT